MKQYNNFLHVIAGVYMSREICIAHHHKAIQLSRACHLVRIYEGKPCNRKLLPQAHLTTTAYRRCAWG